MLTKIGIVNVCIRHKCTKVDSSHQWSNIGGRLVRLEKNDTRAVIEKFPTSKDNVYATTSNSAAEYICKKIALEKCLLKPLNVHKNIKCSVSEQPSNSGKGLLYLHRASDEHVQVPQTNSTENLANMKHEMKSDSDSTKAEEDDTRINEINMQMLPKSLYVQLFKNSEKEESHPTEVIKSIKKTLSSYGISIKNATRVPNPKIQIPKLEGNNIEEHFYNIATAQTQPYLNIIRQIIKNIPEMPKTWLLKEGWVRYTADGAEPVDFPLEDGLVLDIEVCMKAGPLPTLATAVSQEAWYGWVSRSLIEGSEPIFNNQLFTTDMLMHMESKPSENGKRLNSLQKKPKIVVGHNVAFDRSRIKEQYWLNSTGTRFIDTMSLHICVSGVSSYQRAMLKANDCLHDVEEWRHYASLNNLSDVHKLYCGSEISKESRQIFIEGTISDVKKEFNALMNYCASDVIATHSVLQNLFPLFEERFPHPVTLAGILELGSAYLPINSNWQKYIESSESTFEDLNYETKHILSKRADTVCRLMHNEKYKEDLWMWDQDWSTQTIKPVRLTNAKSKQMKLDREAKTKIQEKSDFEKYLTDDEGEEDPLEKEFSYIEQTKHLLPTRMPHLPGYPAWYRKLYPKNNKDDPNPGLLNISTSMQVVPKLLNLTWEKYPLHYIKQHGWGILVPYTTDLDMQTDIPLAQLIAQCPFVCTNNFEQGVDYAMSTLKANVEADIGKLEFCRRKKNKTGTATGYRGSGVWCNVDIDNCCYFFKLPHKDGTKYNVGNPLARDFLSKFSENVLVGLDSSATEILKIARKLSYWRNNRDRIMSQLVIWLPQHTVDEANRRRNRYIRYGAILPQVIVCGTLTRRAVEPTWMTASNTQTERIGSELRSMIQAPPGYNIVGADVDSQELWIASLIGDAHFQKIHGATPFGWMTLIGNKSDGTDMHSVTAKAVGISRDHAKVINYARIYGAGQKFAERLLQQFNPSMTDAEAGSKSQKMFALTKGKKQYLLKPEYVNNDLEDKPYSATAARAICKAHRKTVTEMFKTYEWLGGSESAMFNRLEEIATSPQPVTPFLNSRLSRALEGDEGHLPTKINWVVQSGAVDFLHLMLVSMRWLMKDNARFCISFHDEIRYIVPSRYKYNAALAMHLTNLLTRCFCSSRVGMKDLPMSVAFFTAVEVDTVLRKDSKHDCKTPSNPGGLESGYGIPLGESLDIWATLEKSKGSLGSRHEVGRQNTDLTSA